MAQRWLAATDITDSLSVLDSKRPRPTSNARHGECSGAARNLDTLVHVIKGALIELLPARTVRVARRVRSTVRRALRLPDGSVVAPTRARVAKRYLRGTGIEIGALHFPTKMPPGAKARYVDRMSERDLRAQYPELRTHTFVHVDTIEDGERLASLPAGSVDFIVANHVIEHCLDPIGTLENWTRVIRPGGILFMAVPHRELTFDRDRAPTTWAHLALDRTDGGASSHWAHLLEWASLVERVADPTSRARTLQEQRYSIHCHVWTDAEFRDFLERCRTEAGVDLSIVDVVPNEHEYIVVARTSPRLPQAAS